MMWNENREGPTYAYGALVPLRDMAARAWGRAFSPSPVFCGRADRPGPLAQAGFVRAFGAEEGDEIIATLGD
jgi:hypothetical protein